MAQQGFGSFTPVRLLIYATIAAIGSYLALSALPVLLEKRIYTYELDYTFHGVEAKELWGYFSEFGNLMKANPTLIDYKILHSTAPSVKKKLNTSENIASKANSSKFASPAASAPVSDNQSDSGNDEPIEYSVAYTETLIRLPFLTNWGIANFSIGVGVGAAAAGAEGEIYWINATHVTYQNGGAFYSNDTMAFTPGPPAPAVSAPESASSPSSSSALTLLRHTIAIECPLLLAPFCKYEFTGQRAIILQELSREFVFTVKFELVDG